MSIENTIREFVGDHPGGASIRYWDPDKESPVTVSPYDWKSWQWPGRPFTVRFKDKKLAQAFYVVDYQIRQASLAECLTSNIPYIRECKKWLQRNES